MKTYKIKYNGKAVRAKGEDCIDALTRYSARHVFRNPYTIFGFALKQYDAETRGEKWGEFVSEGYDVNFPISVELA
jgi:hypothetical protein